MSPPHELDLLSHPVTSFLDSLPCIWREVHLKFRKFSEHEPHTRNRLSKVRLVSQAPFRSLHREKRFNVPSIGDVTSTRPIVSNLNESCYAASRIINKHNNSEKSSAKIKNISNETMAFRLLASFCKPRGSRFGFTAVSAICTSRRGERGGRFTSIYVPKLKVSTFYFPTGCTL